MATSIRVKRLQKVAMQRASEVVSYELSDPRMAMVTVTRAELSGDLSYLTLYWSTLAEGGERSATQHALEQARGHVQREIARVFHTRRAPQLRWKFDEGIEGAMRVDKLLDQLAAERGDEPSEAADVSEDETPPSVD